MYELSDLEAFLTKSIYAELNKVGVYDQYKPYAERVVTKETGHTTTTLSADEAVKNEVLPAFAYILEFFSQPLISNLSAEHRAEVRSRHKYGLSVLSRISTTMESATDSAVGTGKISGVNAW